MVARRAHSHQSERGTTVVIVVLVTTLIAAVGVFAVRNAAQVDLAVGYGRIAAQTTSVAELGTTAALSQVAVDGATHSLGKMDSGDVCGANPPKAIAAANAMELSCYQIWQSDLEKSKTLFQAANEATGETGSFGLFSEVQGAVGIELTEKHQTSGPVASAQDGTASYFEVTMTTTGWVRPIQTGADDCSGNGTKSTVKKMMRAHTVIGPMQ